MLMNRKEMLSWLIQTRAIEEETYVDIDRHIPSDIHIPGRYAGIYECTGIYTVWDEVGGIASKGFVWKPVKGGTVLYEV